MDFDKIIKKRRSTRHFTRKRVGWKDILEAVDTAIQGPFAGNQNNLHFVIIENERMIEDIADICDQPWISQSSMCVIVCADETNLESMYGERGRIYSRQQAGAAIQTFILKLIDLGLDSCWVGAYADDMLRRKLRIPDHVMIEAVIPVGHAQGRGEKPDKKRLDSSIFWERWNSFRRPTLFEERLEDDPPV